MVPVLYKSKQIGEFRIDLVVEETVVLELKSVERHDPVFEAQQLHETRWLQIRPLDEFQFAATKRWH